MGNTSGKTAPRSKSNKKTVHWKAADKPLPPGRPQLVAGPPNLDSDVVTLQWERPLSDGGSPVIGYVVEHKRTGSPHWVRATPGLVGKPELSMSGLEPGWRYQFRVIAHNAVDASDPSELSEPLTVTLQRNIITAPRFTTQLQDKTALENDKVEFLVQISGIPAPTVCWYKDGFEIFSSRRTRILTENGQSLLIIYQTSLVDEGEIKCTATNKAGHVTCKATLHVEAPPRIRLPRNYEDGLLFEMDEMIRLKVSVAGTPTPEIFWSHNGESIANDPRYEVANVDKISSVKVKHAKRIDRGEYQVRAVNKLGEHTGTFLVTVTDRPTRPGKISVMSLGKSATLTWSAPEDDGGCKIGNYIIEYFRVGWNVWLKAGTSRKLSTTLGELIEGSEYRFRIKAENPYGISDPSEESETIFIPDPKRGLMEPPLRSKSVPKDVLESMDNVKPPTIQKGNMSVASSKSSLSSRPTSPLINEPIRPSRGNKTKTPSVTPDPSPITRRRDIPNSSPIPNNYFDRSSVVRELSYGTPNKPVKKEVIIKPTENDTKISTTESRENNVLSRPIFNEQNPKITANLESPRNDDILHGSSEFMLVLLPNNKKSANNRKGGSISNINIDFSEAVAPPMSLSAPELGFEPPFLGSLRFAVSSSELLHERAMMRFYEATQNEQAETMSNTSQLKIQPKEYDTISTGSRRHSFDFRNSTEIPTIKIETDEMELLERKHSLRRRLSGSGISQQMLWQRRLSWNAQQKAQAINEQSSSENLKDVQIEEDKLEPGKLRVKAPMIRQRSESEEMEEQVFEQVRAKMAKQSSQEEKKGIDIAPEDKWEEEEVIENEDVEEEEIEDEEESSEDDRPWLKEETTPEIITPQEDEIYHPRLMISKSQPSKVDPTDVPFEILNKPSPLPDPNFIPKPILKKKDNNEINKRNIPEKPHRKNVPIKETSGQILKNIAGSLSQLRMKKSKGDKSKNEMKPQPTIIITAAEAAQKRRLESRQNSLEETQVAIDHYTDIVREYGQGKKPQVPLYLNTEALKKAAESQSSVSGDETNEEVSSRPSSPINRLSKYSESNGGNNNLYKNQSSEESITSKLKLTRKPVESSNESINTKLKQRKLMEFSGDNSVARRRQPRRQIESSEESLSTKSKRKQMESSEESLTSKLKRNNYLKTSRDSLQIKLKNPIELSKQSLNNTSQIRPLKLKDSQSNATSFPTPSTSRIETNVISNNVNKSEQDQLIQAEMKVRTTVNYLTDLAMFIVACWLYLFHDARLAIPILILMVYRQLSDEISSHLPTWLRRIKNS